MTNQLIEQEKEEFPTNKKLVRISRNVRCKLEQNGRKGDDAKKGFPNEKRRKCIAFDKDAWEIRGILEQCRNDPSGNNNPTICCAMFKHCKHVVRKYCSYETRKELIAKVVERAPEGAEEQERFSDELEKLRDKAWEEIRENLQTEKKEREEREKDKENSPPELLSLAPAATNARQPLQTLPFSPDLVQQVKVQAKFYASMRKTYHKRRESASSQPLSLPPQTQRGEVKRRKIDALPTPKVCDVLFQRGNKLTELEKSDFRRRKCSTRRVLFSIRGVSEHQVYQL